MKRFAVALIMTSMLMTAAGVGFAKDLSATGAEEAFVDAVGVCGPSSNIAGSLGKSEDPQVKIALRNALITEAVYDVGEDERGVLFAEAFLPGGISQCDPHRQDQDKADAAGVAGANKPHAECLKKDLTARGYTDDDLGALPYCIAHDWPDPFTGLGQCVKSHGRLEGAINKKS